MNSGTNMRASNVTQPQILIPIATDDDESVELGASAARAARRLAGPDASLLLLAVLPLALRGAGCHEDGSASRNNATMQGAKRRLDALADELEADGPVTTHVSRASDACEEILRAAEEVELVVMPSHARRGVGRLLHGSVAQRVAREATVPVHVVFGADRTDHE